MSGAGSPTIRLSGLSDLKVAIVASMWHDEIMTGLINGALETCAGAGVSNAATWAVFMADGQN